MQGYFTGLGDYDRYLHYVEKGKVITLKELASAFEKPDIVFKVMQGERSE